MSDAIPPIQPVARAEPVSPIRGLMDIDPALYQTFAITLVYPFEQPTSSPNPTSLLFSLWAPPYEKRGDLSSWKKRIRKAKKDSKKIANLFRDVLDSSF